MRLGQGLVTTADVRAFQLAAIAEIRAVSVLMDKYPLSDEDREAVRTAIRRVEGYTVPMAPDLPKEPVSSPTPWWAWALAGLAGFGLGAAAVGALTD